MNKKAISRVAGGVLAVGLLCGAGAGTAVADEGPLVSSETQTGVSVGGLVDAGVQGSVNGTDAGAGAVVEGPAGVSTFVGADAGVGVDVLTDLAATVTASLG